MVSWHLNELANYEATSNINIVIIFVLIFFSHSLYSSWFIYFLTCDLIAHESRVRLLIEGA